MLRTLNRNITTSNCIRFKNIAITLRTHQIHSIHQNSTNNVLHSTDNNNETLDNFTIEFHKNHIKLSPIQRFILSAGASVAALIDPARHDMIASLGETTGHAALKKIYNKMLETGEGRQVLLDKPRINTATIDIENLRSLAENTFGRTYVKFLDDNKVTPDSRMEVRFVDDPNLAYVMTRYRECHDLVHSVLNMPTNMLGEVAVKWVEALNTGLPMCYGAAIFGAIRLRPKQRQKYTSMYLPWAIANGKRIKPLLSVYYEKRWAQDITELRKELGIIILKDC